jgi:hypothetical protein
MTMTDDHDRCPPTSTPGERSAPGEAATPTSNARIPSHTDRQRSCPPLYTYKQHKTITILAGVGGGNSTFSIIKKQRQTDRQRSPQATTQKTNPGRPRLVPGLAAFRENRRQTTATQWRGYTV